MFIIKYLNAKNDSFLAYNPDLGFWFITENQSLAKTLPSKLVVRQQLKIIMNQFDETDEAFKIININEESV